MIIFLSGPDSWRLKEKLKELVSRYEEINTGALYVQRFDFSSQDFSDMAKEIAGPSLFQAKKLLIGENIAVQAQELFGWKSKIVQSPHVFIFCQQGDRKAPSPLLRFFKENAKCQEFAVLEGVKLKNWILKEAAKQGLQLETAALERLAREGGEDLWRLSAAIQKIAAFKKSEKDSLVRVSHIEKLVASKADASIFATIEAAASGNKAKALWLIRTHIAKGDSPLYLLSMIAFQFRSLLEIKDLLERNYTAPAIAAATKLHPFVVKKGVAASKSFSLTQLKSLYNRLCDIDRAVKTGKGDAQTLLSLFIATL